MALMLAYFVWGGRLLKRYEKGHTLPPAKTLRVMNELPALVLLGIVSLVIGKPL